MPKMGVNPEETKAPKPVPAAWYTLKLKGLVCKKSKSGKGVNYEAYTEVVNNRPELNGSFVPVRMNNGFNQGRTSTDFCHGIGIPLETDGSFPGDWKLKDGIKEMPDGSYQNAKGETIPQLDAFDGAQYTGPLLGKTFEAEVTVYNYDGQDRNDIKQIKCKIPDCNTRFPDIRHLLDWRGKDKK